MVDSVIDTIVQEDPNLDVEGRTVKLVLIACALTLPTALKHHLDYRRNFWKVGGASRNTLQANLLRKYLANDVTSRAWVRESFPVQTPQKDAVELVADGYLQTFPIAGNIGNLLMVAGLQL